MRLSVRGLETYLYTGGKAPDAGRDAILFVHGAQHDHSVWNLQSRYFAHHGHNVLAVDLPGHGRSEGAPLASVEAIAAWLIEVLDAAGHARATLVGHSMGSLAALEAAARHPQRVARLALLGSAVPMPVSRALLDAARDDEPRAMAMINVWSHGPRGLMGGAGAPGMWVFGANASLMAHAAPGVLHTDLAACNAYLGGLDAARAVRCPTLLLAGDRDQMTPARATRGVIEALAELRVVTLAGAGHNMTAEQPGRVLDALREFLAATPA